MSTEQVIIENGGFSILPSVIEMGRATLSDDEKLPKNEIPPKAQILKINHR